MARPPIAELRVAITKKMREAVPDLMDITDKILFGQVWQRPGLSMRDRSLVVVATLIANYRSDQLHTHIHRAIENGITYEEIGEIITHLAFYAGWPCAMNAGILAKDVFDERGPGPQTPTTKHLEEKKMAQNSSVAATRAASKAKVQAVAPDFIELNDNLLFGQVWERKALSKRDRSVITVATLIALYRSDQLRSHIDRALNNGVTKEEIGEIIMHQAFYAGWPCAMNAGIIAKEVFDERDGK